MHSQYKFVTEGIGMEKKNLIKQLLLLHSSSAINKAEETLEFLSRIAKIEERSKLNAEFSNLLQEENNKITYCSEVYANEDGYGDSNGVPQVLDWDPLLLWYLPNLCCIRDIEIMVRGVGLSSISSIGCGCGLLEWIITSLTGLKVTGYEINELWWNSSYAPPKFIPLVYVDAEGGAEAEDIPSIPPDHALLFCYFNDIDAFRSYLGNYKGDCLIIIGSLDGKRVTNPNPLELTGSRDWNLIQSHVKKNHDVICCYRRVKTDLLVEE